ncbi:leucine--tRNA ligase [Patescibacteria group bacterium]
MTMLYNPQKIEKKWQKIWEESGIYKIPDKIKGKKNFYHLVMFPYPSGDLHIGHWYNFGPADIYARFKKMQGLNVMSPFGFDAFGLPAENAAIKRKLHPRTWTKKNIQKMRKQLKSLGNLYDWSREISTCEPEYYKWTQWMFLQLYKAGLAYRKKVPCNFCPSCKTVLANEQVAEGKCERCDSEVLQKEIEQWLFKITDYAEELLKDLGDLDWPERTKAMQRNWIGKSEGWEIRFKIKDTKPEAGEDISVFTTRIDTLFGCTYLVVAPEHSIIEELKPQIKNYKFVLQYIEESKKKTEKERISEIKGKTGIEIKGVKAVNPANNREILIFVADYVLAHYGTGAIMAVPAHDQRDFDFAIKYNLSIIEVIKPERIKKVLPKEISLVVSDGRPKQAYEGEGILVNSGRFNGLQSEKAKERIGDNLSKKGLAKKNIYYKLRDWLISRQRYWGAPIPMVLCKACGWVPVSEQDLPVLLPRVKNYLPTKEGKSPLAKVKNFVNVKCPECKGEAERETDTMDTFVCSSWYFLRYADPQNTEEFASKKKIKNWLPINMYIGGAEHSVMHLLYARFFTKALERLGYLDFKEPFLSLRHQGIILGPDFQKMSKSKGNVVDPDPQVEKYGADAVRMYLCFMGPYDQGGPWQLKGIIGICRFLGKVWHLVEQWKENQKVNPKTKSKNPELEKLFQKTIKKVTQDIENFRFNTAISALMILVNQLTSGKKQVTKKHLKNLLLLLAPFAPHFAEEVWQTEILGVQVSDFKASKSIHSRRWPRCSQKLVEEKKIQIIIQVNGKVRGKSEAKVGISENEARKLALSQENIQRWIEDKEIKKVIFVPDKLINVVV